MRKFPIAALLAALTVGASPAFAQDDHSTVVPTGCSHLYSQPYYRAIARQLIPRRGPKTGPHKLYRLAAMRRCARTPEAHVGMRAYTHLLLNDQRLWAEYVAITPFSCPDGTRWAVPCYIVRRESGESWAAHNPSGASGPYQLLGWGEIYPARTFAEKMQNHRIAYRLWNHGVDTPSGLGPHNWTTA